MEKNRVGRLLLLLALTMALIVVAGGLGLAEDYSASTIRLLRFDGDVEVKDADGNPRFLVENIRFNSGESMHTGTESIASLGLDGEKILSMDQESSVQFEKQGNALTLTLTEGTLLLDVQEKLDENESLDIQTSTMVVGIRGTVLYVADLPIQQMVKQTIEAAPQQTGASSSAGRMTVLGVLEGVATVSYIDANGVHQVIQVAAGQLFALDDEDGDGQAEQAGTPRQLTKEDVQGFVTLQVASDPATLKRVQIACDVMDDETPYPDVGLWGWDEPVTLVAQSASKMFDGTPLTRSGDVLVYGLPRELSISVIANGTLTDAGRTDNPIAQYRITNARGEDVTGHFTNIQTVSGTLVVDPAPLVIWTGSAEKAYDGTPLVYHRAGVRTTLGYEYWDPLWRNTSIVITETDGSEVLYGLCGTVWAHGTNPITGESQEIAVGAGEKMSVYLYDDGGAKSIEFRIECVSEQEIPEAMLRVYAENPDLLKQACKDAGWDLAIVVERIAQLPTINAATIEQDGLRIMVDMKDSIMRDFTNVRIAIDTEITDYNGRALDGGEAHYTRVELDQSISVIATGSRTEVGWAVNTYEITWGTANPKNYILDEDLGTLTVYQAAAAGTVTFTAGSAQKAYDGQPLTCGDVSVSGLPAGYTCLATTSGSQTAAGTSANTVASYTILDAAGTDVTASFSDVVLESGALTVTPRSVSFDLNLSSASYTGSPILPSRIVAVYDDGTTVEGALVMAATSPLDAPASATRYFALAGGTKVKLECEGYADVGTYTLVPTCTFLSGSADNFNISFTNNTVTIQPMDITLELGGSSSVYYDGEFHGGAPSVTTASGSAEITQTGDEEWEIAWSWGGVTTVTIAGGGVDADEYPLDCTYDGNANLNITLAGQVLTIQPLPVTFDLGGGERTYDWDTFWGDLTVTCDACTPGIVYNEGGDIEYWTLIWPWGAEMDVFIQGTTVIDETEYTGWIDTAGEYTLVAEVYCDGDFEENYNITLTNTALTINPMPVTVSLGGGEKVYDGAVYEISPTITYDSDDPITPYGLYVTVLDADGEEAEPLNAGDYTLTCDLSSYWYTPQNFDVTIVNDTVTITPRPIVFDMNLGYETAYSGYPHVPNAIVGTWFDEETLDPYQEWHSSSASDSYFYGYAAAFHLIGDDDLMLVYDVDELVDYEDESTWYNMAYFVGSYTLVPSCSWETGNANNYAISFTNNTITVIPMDVTITLETATMSYIMDDYYAAVSVTADTDYVYLYREDFCYELYVGGACLSIYSTNEVGPGENVLTCTYEFDEDSDGPENFNIVVVPGKLTVTNNNNAVTIKSETVSMVYDGSPLTGSCEEVTGLPYDFTAEVTCSGSQTAAGSSDNTISAYTIYNSRDEEVTSCFTNVTLLPGTLTVYPLQLQVDLGGGTYVYGTAANSPSATILNGYHTGETVTFSAPSWDSDGACATYTAQLFTGDTMELSVSYGAAGDSSWDYIMFPASGFDGADDSYEVTYINDTYTATPKAVAVTTTSGSKAYDGVPLTGSASITGLTDRDAQLVCAVATGSVTDAGSVTNTYEFRALLDGGIPGSEAVDLDDYGCYTVTESLGTLTVTPAALTVRTGSGEKAFDGEPLTNEEASVEGLMAAGVPVTETPSGFIVTDGEVTNAGSADNTYTINWNDEYRRQNYTVEAEDIGSLTVTPREVVLYVVIHTDENDWVLGYEPVMRSEGLSWEDYSSEETGDHTVQFYLPWGDVIEATAEESDEAYSLSYRIVEGDSGNYQITIGDPVTVKSN